LHVGDGPLRCCSQIPRDNRIHGGEVVAGGSGDRALNSFCSITNRCTENAQVQSLLCLRLKIRRTKLQNLAESNSRIQSCHPRGIVKNGVLVVPYWISISGNSAAAFPFLDSSSFHYVKPHVSRKQLISHPDCCIICAIRYKQ
jgi:hypothetical protein